MGDWFMEHINYKDVLFVMKVELDPKEKNLSDPKVYIAF